MRLRSPYQKPPWSPSGQLWSLSGHSQVVFEVTSPIMSWVKATWPWPADLAPVSYKMFMGLYPLIEYVGHYD